MVIKLYNNMSDINVLGKNLLNERTVNAVLKDTTNFLRPSLELNTPAQSFNYFYIPSFGRYYFIDDYSIIRNNLLRIVGRVDVLETYKNDVLNSYGLMRKGKNYNKYYGTFESEVREERRIINFENNFNESGQLVLITVNGGDNTEQ